MSKKGDSPDCECL